MSDMPALGRFLDEDEPADADEWVSSSLDRDGSAGVELPEPLAVGPGPGAGLLLDELWATMASRSRAEVVEEVDPRFCCECVRGRAS